MLGYIVTQNPKKLLTYLALVVSVV
ncbi:hypothetical protein CAEBREN_26106 [Caenorhabditis brenneri]|uniref:Uncharacterized protein n=1 Tax=Caenorhabditis brenneri TaxID=135651 RepID=G0NST6_CAEBE|nr:hypothetical protein CAEBREN_26106 [Caenorhabditis brenneri]